MKIFIDAGHGGASVGATYKGRKEQDDCLKLALAVKNLLLSQKDVEVALSREGDTNPSITERCRMANEWKADYFLSIHRNAIGVNKAQGAESWVYSEVEKNGVTYTKAEKILNSLCEEAKFINRGVKLGAPSYKDFGVNRLTEMSSCLLEVGFIDSDKDNKIFDENFDSMALGIARGILNAFGREFITSSLKGDVNSDGKITAEDARLILRAAVGLEEIPVEKGDMDNDGKITANDAREALRKAVDLE